MNNEKYRMVSWWITWGDLDWPSSDNLDRVRKRADLMADSGVNAAVIFGTHFRWDFMPYWTILHDYLATVGSELKQRGIALFDHHSATLVHRYDNRKEWHKVKLHSVPHLPFSPERKFAADWKFNGSYLNDWLMIDLETGKPAWHEKYTAEEFCFVNPEFRMAYLEYLRKLIADTAIDGLMSDDHIYFNTFRSCGCRYCRNQFFNRFGYELPEYGDPVFWGNWKNPDWNGYLDMRFQNNGDMLQAVRSVLPSPEFPLMSCCSGSSTAYCCQTGQDIRQFMRACNLVHLEMCGNIPPWKGDPKVRAISIGKRIAMAQHHRNIGEENGSQCIGLGYGFTEPVAGIVWALNKFLGSGCWFSTLKGRLGLPESILETLADDASLMSSCYRFEAEHPQIFSGTPVAQVGIYFSYETRNHSFYGNLEDGFPKEFFDAMTGLIENGIPAIAVCRIPEDCRKYPLLILPGAAVMTEEEIDACRSFMASGGRILACGPCGYPGVEMDWPMPSQPINFKNPLFLIEEKPVPCHGERRWLQINDNFYWNPGYVGEVISDLMEQIRSSLVPGPVEIIEVKGYYCSIHHNPMHNLITVHFLAMDYHTEINEELNSKRYHQSMMNVITSAVPENISSRILLKSPGTGIVYTPLSSGNGKMERMGEYFEVHLPPHCPYAVITIEYPNLKEGMILCQQ